MNIIKFTALMLSFVGTVGTSSAQDSPPHGCYVDNDQMGRGEIRHCVVRSTNSQSRLVIENRHGTISAYINFKTMLRNHKTVVIRWNDEKAVTTAMTRSSDFKAMFFANAHSAISKMAQSKTLMVESETYQRGISVDTFAISNGEAMANYVLKRSNSKPSSSTTSAPTPDKLVQDLQLALNQRGFNAGAADGYMGQQTQSAIIAAQRKLGLNANGLPSTSLLAELHKLSVNNPSGTIDNNQTGGGSSQGYGAKVRACIQPGISFAPPPRGNTNPAVQYRVDLRPDGTVAGFKLTRSSGNPNFDRAVETGIRRCSPFPTPPSGKYPGYMDVNYSMYN